MNPKESLPLSSTASPTSPGDVAIVVRDCVATETPIYPFGGGTSLDYGVSAKTQGIGLSLAGLSKVIDYQPRDMTITLEAGATMQQLADTLAAEKQELPIDVPHPEQATLGGVIATNWNGPRRYGCGAIRDYVIGISAVDGHGMAFKGGGRVVKNVAGYDFCKLLTGSLGTLGIITQVTLKLRPQAEKSICLVAAVNLAKLETVLSAVSGSPLLPASINAVSGLAWSKHAVLGDIKQITRDEAFLIVSFDGTEHEVAWQIAHAIDAWAKLGLASPLSTIDSTKLMPELVGWPRAGESPLVVKANVKPSGVAPLVDVVRKIDPDCSLLSHAGSGVVFVKFSQFPKNGLSRMLVGELQPAAAKLGGQVLIVSNPSGAEMTRQSVWGGNPGSLALMQAVKRKFDPKDILNRGRFVM